LRSGNFSIYAQWLSVLCILRMIPSALILIIVCIALGIVNIFQASLIIIFSIVCLYFTSMEVCLTGVELQESYSSLLKHHYLCVFFVPRQRNTMSLYNDSTRIRFALECTLGIPSPSLRRYSLSAVQFCSIISGTSSLIAAAIVLLLTGTLYGTPCE